MTPEDHEAMQREAWQLALDHRYHCRDCGGLVDMVGPWCVPAERADELAPFGVCPRCDQIGECGPNDSADPWRPTTDDDLDGILIEQRIPLPARGLLYPPADWSP